MGSGVSAPLNPQAQEQLAGTGGTNPEPPVPENLLHWGRESPPVPFQPSTREQADPTSLRLGAGVGRRRVPGRGLGYGDAGGTEAPEGEGKPGEKGAQGRRDSAQRRDAGRDPGARKEAQRGRAPRGGGAGKEGAAEPRRAVRTRALRGARVPASV